MNTLPNRPVPKCWCCGDWGTVIPREGGKPVPCPEKCPAARKTQAR